MKIMRQFTLAMIALLFLGLASCTKSDETMPENPILTDGSITLKADGVSWSASLAVQAVNTNGVINITGSDANAKQASILLYGIHQTGTYQMAAGIAHQLRWTAGLDQNDTYMANGLVGSGTITITELTATKVKGSFSFTGVNTTGASQSITDGIFTANF
jgi:hypothetical protein